jgi:hypothetical protein
LFIFTGGSYKLEVVLYKRPRWINYWVVASSGHVNKSGPIIGTIASHATNTGSYDPLVNLIILIMRNVG